MSNGNHSRSNIPGQTHKGADNHQNGHPEQIQMISSTFLWRKTDSLSFNYSKCIRTSQGSGTGQRHTNQAAFPSAVSLVNCLAALRDRSFHKQFAEWVTLLHKGWTPASASFENNIMRLSSKYKKVADMQAVRQKTKHCAVFGGWVRAR